jgi:hypothetical protein
MEHYVYCHQRKDNGKCFYIGKGKGKRYADEQFRNRHWHFIANKYGFTPVILVSGLSEEKAFELEASFIKQIGVENLTNMDVPNGWGGHTKSEETKAKIGKANSGKVFSKEHKAKISKANKGRTWEVEGRIGVPRSEECKAKIGEKNRRPKPKGFGAILSEAKKGQIYNISAETKAIRNAKISKALKGKTHNEETKAKISKALKGKTYSEETKAKISKAKKGKLNPKNSKPILQFDLQGNFIREWANGYEAYKALNVSQAGISEVCKGKRKYSKGFIWKFKNI